MKRLLLLGAGFSILGAIYFLMIHEKGLNLSNIIVENEFHQQYLIGNVLNDKRIIIFYSEQCDACKKYLSGKDLGSIMKINVDKEPKQKYEWKLVKNNVLKIYYTPMIIEVDNNCNYLKEIFK